MTPHRFAAAFFAAVLVVGCDSNDMDDEMDMVLDDDVEFIDFFVNHHTMAIEMADMVIERGERAEVKAFAQRIKDAQTAEINQMRDAREELTGDPDSPEMEDPHGELDMSRMMSASGAQLDALFLENMLPHHAGGVQMAHNALPNLERSDMRTLAESIIEMQSNEIEEIRILMGKADTHAET